MIIKVHKKKNANYNPLKMIKDEANIHKVNYQNFDHILNHVKKITIKNHLTRYLNVIN